MLQETHSNPNHLVPDQMFDQGGYLLRCNDGHCRELSLDPFRSLLYTTESLRLS